MSGPASERQLDCLDSGAVGGARRVAEPGALAVGRTIAADYGCPIEVHLRVITAAGNATARRCCRVESHLRVIQIEGGIETGTGSTFAGDARSLRSGVLLDRRVAQGNSAADVVDSARCVADNVAALHLHRATDVQHPDLVVPHGAIDQRDPAALE